MRGPRVRRERAFPADVAWFLHPSTPQRRSQQRTTEVNSYCHDPVYEYLNHEGIRSPRRIGAPAREGEMMGNQPESSTRSRGRESLDSPKLSRRVFGSASPAPPPAFLLPD